MQKRPSVTLLLLLTVLAFALSLAGCLSDGKIDTVIGHWKSTKTNMLTGEHHVAILTKDTLFKGGSIMDVKYSVKDGLVMVTRKGKDEPFTSIKIMGKDHIKMEDPFYGSPEYVRTTEQEVQQILKGGSPALKPKADPF